VPLRVNKKQLIRDYCFVFASPEGQRVLEDLKKKVPAYLLSGLQTNPRLDSNRMMYLEGQRSVLLYIFKMMNLDPYAEIPTHVLSEKEE
jgi:hypothetical protein